MRPDVNPVSSCYATLHYSQVHSKPPVLLFFFPHLHLCDSFCRYNYPYSLMQYVRSISGSVSKTWNSINPATLSGAIDVIVVEREDGITVFRQ